ncbi:MAG: hypothetical protein ACJ8D5_07655 [Sphingomicrobium sp.]
MESDARFFRRRANEELAAASRAVTDAARQRRMILAEIFLDRLKAVESEDETSAFPWARRSSAGHA